MVKAYFYNIGYAVVRCIDMVCNSILGGDPRETISRRIGRAIERRENCTLCSWLCTTLNWIDPNHCQRAADAPAPDGGMAVDKDL